MTRSRFSELHTAAVRARKLAIRFGSVPLDALPKVTLTESTWLGQHKPGLLPYTKLFNQSGWKTLFPNAKAPSGMTTSRITPSRIPLVREIWVGSRSLAAVGETEAADGHQRSQTEQEDAAELTDMQTMTYGNAEYAEKVAFGLACERYLRALAIATVAHTWRVNLRFCKTLWNHAYQQAVFECAHTCVIEDPESSEVRLVRPGDIIQTAWGSNEDLDAMYLEEPASERSESDGIEREFTRNQIRANSYMEEQFFNGRESAEEPAYVAHIDQLRESELFPEQDEFRLRQQASRKCDEYFDQHPDSPLEPLKVYDFAFNKLRSIESEWVNAKDFWAQMETNARSHKAPHLLRRAPPKPIDRRVLKVISHRNKTWDVRQDAPSRGHSAAAV